VRVKERNVHFYWSPWVNSSLHLTHPKLLKSSGLQWSAMGATGGSVPCSRTLQHATMGRAGIKPASLPMSCDVMWLEKHDTFTSVKELNASIISSHVGILGEDRKDTSSSEKTQGLKPKLYFSLAKRFITFNLAPWLNHRTVKNKPQRLSSGEVKSAATTDPGFHNGVF